MGSLEADEVYALLKKKIGQGGGGTSDYSDLNNLPQINGVELKGNKSTADLKINDVFIVGENTTFGDVATAVDAGKPVFLEGQLVQANKDDDSGASVGASMLQSVSDNQIISITGSYAGNLSEKVFDAEPNYGERIHYAPKSLMNSTLSYDTSTFKNLLDELHYDDNYPEGYEVYFYWYDDAAIVEKLLSARIPSTHESIIGAQAVQTYGVSLQLNTGYGVLQQTIKGAETDLLKDLIDFAKFTPIREPIFPTESNLFTEYILPGIFYDFGESEYLSIELESDGAENVLTNEYHFAFTSGSTPTNLVLPSTVKTDIVVEANMYYECSILNDKMVFREWAMGVGPR